MKYKDGKVPANVLSAMRCRDVKVPYILKKALFYPLMEALRETVIKNRVVRVHNFGTFKLVPIKANVAVGEKERKDYVAVKFKPARKFIEEAVAEWSDSLEELPRSKKDKLPSSREPVSFAGGKVAEASSVEEEGAPEGTSTTSGTDW